MKRTIRFFLTLSALGFGLLPAQTTSLSQADLETFLTREWIHTPVAATVDQYATGKCENGKSYVFAPKGVLEVHECVQNRMRSTRQSWALSQSEFGEWQVKLGDKEYLLETSAAPGQDKLILTPVFPETSGDEPVVMTLYRMTPVAAEEVQEEGRD